MLISESKIRSIIKRMLIEEIQQGETQKKEIQNAKNNNITMYLNNLKQSIMTTFGNKKYNIFIYECEVEEADPVLQTGNIEEMNRYIKKSFKSFENVQVLGDTIESIYMNKENKDFKIKIQLSK
jgi:hypothetical protein